MEQATERKLKVMYCFEKHVQTIILLLLLLLFI